MFERFTEEARSAVHGAQAHARTFRHGWIGTEHLLLGLLDEPDTRAARILRARGVTGEAVRAEIVERVGLGEPDLDADALATIGIDLDAVRERVERRFGPGALARRRRRCRRGRVSFAGELPFTPRAKKALELSLREALAMEDRFIGAEHVLLGLVRADGVAHDVLGGRGIDRAAVVAALGRDPAR
jgi:ATP-dependent Clp protease ATP-binding subunit ClpA